jgi:hypothetical protein
MSETVIRRISALGCAAVVALATACFAFPQGDLRGACAEPGAPVLEGARVIVYGSNDNFVQSECVLIEGVVTDGDCQVSSPGSGDFPGPNQQIEVAHDPETCRSLFEVGQAEPGP